jgi:hypothetical protein
MLISIAGYQSDHLRFYPFTNDKHWMDVCLRLLTFFCCPSISLGNITMDSSSPPPNVLEAAKLYRLSVGRDVVGLTPVEAMIMVGINRGVAVTSYYNESFRASHFGLNQRLGGPIAFNPHTDTDGAKLERAVGIFRLATNGRDGGTRIVLAEIMRLAGYPKDVTTTGGGHYKKFSQELTKLGLKNTSSTTVTNHPPPPPLPQAAQDDARTCVIETRLLPQTVAFGDQRQEPGPSPMTCDTAFNYSAVSDSNNSQPCVATARPTQADAISAVSQLTGGVSHRKSSEEAHRQRREKRDFQNIEKSAYKVGSVLYNTVRAGQNPLEKFNSSDKCADAVNELFGIKLPSGDILDVVSGRQVADACRADRVGKSLPRRSRPS